MRGERYCAPLALTCYFQTIERDTVADFASDTNWEVRCPVKLKFILLHDDYDTAPCSIDRQSILCFDNFDRRGLFWGKL
jgi:hypothetical protein